MTALLKIGQVLAELRGEYPDLELSKIRYYEDQGLVLPQRSKKGYRLYAERDVACLREAIRLADQEFLPLRVIRHRLIEQGLLDDVAPTKMVTKQAAKAAGKQAVSLVVPEREPSRPVLRAVSVDEGNPSPTLHDVPETMALAEVLERSGVDASVLTQLVAQGLLVPGVQGREQFFRRHDLDVARAAAVLVRNGADLRALSALRRVVEREVGIVGDLTAPVRMVAPTSPETALLVRRTADEVAALRDALLRRDLEDFLLA